MRSTIRSGAVAVWGLPSAVGLSIVMSCSPADTVPSRAIIFTQLSDSQLDRTVRPEGWRFPIESRIVLLEQGNDSITVLTEGFHAARAPMISFDGARMLFAGQRQPDEPWQIWEMHLDDQTVVQITAADRDVTDPAYLAGDRVVFSAPAAFGPDAPGTAYGLYTAQRSGSDTDRITYHPNSDTSPSPLEDGRILFASTSAGPQERSRLLVMRPDGTKAELFYHGDAGSGVFGRAWATSGGEVVFVERSQHTPSRGALIAVSRYRPMNSRRVLAPQLEGSFHSVFPVDSVTLVVSYRPVGSRRYQLYQLDVLSSELTPIGPQGAADHAVEPVVALERPQPKAFLSVIDRQNATGVLYCLDADASALPVSAGSDTRTSMVRVSTAAGTLAEVPVEEDGSFHIELPAETPVRFETLDADGSVRRGPSAWIWVRPNESRGCIGCHENREFAPENRVPLALTKTAVPLSTESSAVAAAAAQERGGRER